MKYLRILLVLCLMLCSACLGGSKKFLILSDLHAEAFADGNPANQGNDGWSTAGQDGSYVRVYSNWEDRLLEACRVGVANSCDYFVLLGDNLDGTTVDPATSWATVLAIIENNFSVLTSGDGIIIPIIGNHETANTTWAYPDFISIYQATVNASFQVTYGLINTTWPEQSITPNRRTSAVLDTTDFLIIPVTTFNAFTAPGWDDPTYLYASIPITEDPANTTSGFSGKRLTGVGSSWNTGSWALEAGDIITIASGTDVTPGDYIVDLVTNDTTVDVTVSVGGFASDLVYTIKEDNTPWKTQLAWLEDNALAAANKTTIILSHYWLDKTALFNLNGRVIDGVPNDGSDNIQTLLKAHFDAGNLTYVFSGHVHSADIDTTGETPKDFNLNTGGVFGGVKYYGLRGSIIAKSANDKRGNACHVVTIDTVNGVTELKTYKYKNTARDRYDALDLDNTMGSNQRRSRY